MNMLAPWVWKVLASALLLSLAFGGWQWVRAGRAGAAVTTVESERDTLKAKLKQTEEQRGAASKSADQWQGLFQQLTETFKKERQSLEDMARSNAAAAANALAAKRESDAAFSAWLDRYAKAAREPACGSLLEQKLSACMGAGL